MSVPSLWIISRIGLCLTSHYPKTPTPVVNNPIGFQISWLNIGSFLRVLGRVQTNPISMVRSSKVTIQCGFRLDNFGWKHNSMGFFLGRITWRINVIPESWMKWTWQHSKLAVKGVSFYRRLEVALLQICISLHDGAVGVNDLDVVLLRSGQVWAAN